MIRHPEKPLRPALSFALLGLASALGLAGCGGAIPGRDARLPAQKSGISAHWAQNEPPSRGDGSAALSVPPPLPPPPPPPPPGAPAEAPRAAVTIPATQPPPARAFGPDNAVWVRFSVDDEDHPWVVLSKEGQLVCTVPCQLWVGRDSGLSIQRADTASLSYRVSVPSDPGFAPGSRASATVLPKRGSEVGPAIMLYAGGSISVSVLTVGIVCLAANCEISPAADVALIAGSSAYIAAAASWFFWTRRITRTEWKYEGDGASSEDYAIDVLPGAISIARKNGSGAVLGPGFLVGSF